MTNEMQRGEQRRVGELPGRTSPPNSTNAGFSGNLPKRPGMVRNIRHFFERGEVTEQELRTLHGIVTELARGRRQTGRIEEP